ncbi:hypothetical protein [Sphingomonas elodea]|uniref:hypothetical protein n=1 Tax=Sphingomonas elodea TaxID=179878 RepID=UPI0002F96E6C|nr:hypothetical protein [Sphingomonas elodea]
MKRMIMTVVGAALATTGAAAQSSGQSGSHNPVVKDGTAHHVAAPAKGRSSFTEDQAKGRLMKAGYTDITDLKGTRNGAWQGMAMKNGKKMTVTLDYKGNVTAR